jgi:hypothetical protein
MEKAKKKHPSEMTNAELAEHVFHPTVLKHARKHVDELNSGSSKPKKTSKKLST